MTWRYTQSTGVLAHDTTRVATGYSGHGDGLDNPAAERAVATGPIPRGRYAIGTPHDSPHVGLFAMTLTPLPGTDTHGRSGFLMHGDNRALDHSASHGCIVVPLPARLIVARSGDKVLEVVA